MHRVIVSLIIINNANYQWLRSRSNIYHQKTMSNAMTDLKGINRTAAEYLIDMARTKTKRQNYYYLFGVSYVLWTYYYSCVDHRQRTKRRNTYHCCCLRDIVDEIIAFRCLCRFPPVKIFHLVIMLPARTPLTSSIFYCGTPRETKTKQQNYYLSGDYVS